MPYEPWAGLLFRHTPLHVCEVCEASKRRAFSTAFHSLVLLLGWEAKVIAKLACIQVDGSQYSNTLFVSPHGNQGDISHKWTQKALNGFKGFPSVVLGVSLSGPHCSWNKHTTTKTMVVCVLFCNQAISWNWADLCWTSVHNLVHAHSYSLNILFVMFSKETKPALYLGCSPMFLPMSLSVHILKEYRNQDRCTGYQCIIWKILV